MLAGISCGAAQTFIRGGHCNGCTRTGADVALVERNLCYAVQRRAANETRTPVGDIISEEIGAAGLSDEAQIRLNSCDHLARAAAQIN
ncbi:hypothetical protein L596_025006 [Steinernema carpocapsae]|uniref:Uncharacterized protein n=1 Tax=Steinernema carpocapsae TaxID=34508 RepID=A0A4U5M7D0_STECR|nr:hypothetical protein L596_025006 [Steinernema carpocapsae]